MKLDQKGEEGKKERKMLFRDILTRYASKEGGMTE